MNDELSQALIERIEQLARFRRERLESVRISEQEVAVEGLFVSVVTMHVLRHAAGARLTWERTRSDEVVGACLVAHLSLRDKSRVSISTDCSMIYTAFGLNIICNVARQVARDLLE